MLLNASNLSITSRPRRNHLRKYRFKGEAQINSSDFEVNKKSSATYIIGLIIDWLEE